MSMLLPARAVQMQQDGMSPGEIAEALGVSSQQVVAWWQIMGYDPAIYHIERIAEMVSGDTPLYTALADCGMSTSGGVAARVRTMLRERGIDWHVSEANIMARRTGQPYCLHCGILLEPYDASNREQQAWENGTRDGIHCARCESIINNGGGWLGRLPLPCEDAEINVGEALRYA